MSADAALRRQLGRAGIAEPARAAERVRAYATELGRWNARINLVGRRVLEELESVHLPDAIAVAGQLPAEVAEVVDVGSGGGLPAVLLAVLRPELRVVALEPVRKKHAFLSSVRRKLDLEGLEPRPERDDEHLALVGEQRYDAAISRATFELPEWLERGAKLVRPGGLVVGLEGARRHELPAAARRIGYGAADRTRSLVLMPVGDR